MVQLFTRQTIFARRSFTAQLLLLAVSLICLGTSSLLAAPTFTAKLDRSTVAVGERVNLSLVFQDGSPETQPALPTIPGVQQAGLSASQNFAFVNGKSTAEMTYTFVLIPTKQGGVTIPPISVKVDGKSLASQPLKLTVTAAAPPPKATAPEGQPAEAFMKLVLPKNELYLGEIVPAELRLYVQFARNPSLPQVQAEGFTVSQMSNRPEQSQVHVNGVQYTLVTFRFSVSPAKTGSLLLGPATCTLELLSEPRRNFFGETVFTQARQVTLTSDTNRVQVLPLPGQNRPSTFNGAIGQFTMQMEAGPNDIAVGDPITVKVQIGGHGALDSISLPPQPAWREFKMYTPNSRVETSDPLGLEGVKHFELVISPQNAGIKELPPFAFSYFDPEQKAYRTLTSAAIPLNVRPTSSTPQPTIVSANTTQGEDAPESKEIVHIKSQLGTLRSPETALIRQPWFIGLQLTPPLLWLGSLLYRRRKESLENNPRLRRQREVDRIVSEGVNKLQQQAAANRSEEFFATVFRLLQEQIGERLDQPASGITEAALDELKRRGMHPDSLGRLRELFDLCNQARYAPVRGSQQLASIIPRVEEMLSELKKLKNEHVALSV